MAYIAKYKDKWRVQIQRDGQRTSKVFDTKREAQAWSVQIESTSKLRAVGWHTFNEAAKRYLEEVSILKSGHKWEAARLRVMCEHFGPMALGTIDAPDIAAWRDKRLQTVTGSTVIREVNLLRHVFRLARDEWRWMENDPFRGVKLPKENQPRTAVWRWQLIRRVLRAGRRAGGKIGETTDAFHLSLRTAMRLKEVLQAPANFSGMVVTLADTKTGKRVIPVGRIARKLLARQPFKVSPNEASTLFAKLTGQLLIDGLTFHDARGTALTLLAKKVDCMTLAKISGHKDVSLLMNTYYRATPSEIALKL